MPNAEMAVAKSSAWTLILLYKTLMGNDLDIKLLKTLATVQCQGLSICTIAHSTLKRLSDLGGSAQAILAKDSELHLMLNSRQQRKKRAAYRKDLESARTAVLSAPEKMQAIFGQNEDRVGCLQGLVDLDISEIFDSYKCEGVSYEEIYQECLSVHSANLCTKLQAAGDAAVQACQGWQQGGPHFWRAEAQAAASVQELTELMNKTVTVISLKDLKKSTDDFIDVRH